MALGGGRLSVNPLIFHRWYPYHIPIISPSSPLREKQRSLWHPGPIRSYLVYAINPFRNVVMILLQTIWPRMKLGSVFFSGMDYGKMAAKEITKLVFKTRMSLRFMVVIRSYKLYFMGFIWVYKPAYIWEPHLLVVEPRWGTFPGRFLRATSLEWCEDDANFRRNLGSYPGCHWIGLRENIQETMVFFTMKYGGFLYFFPLNKSNEDDFLIFFMQDVQWLVPSCFGMMTGDE